jgi:hypothetical protein
LLGISVKAQYNGTTSFNNDNATIEVSGLKASDSPAKMTVTASSSDPNVTSNYVTVLSSTGFNANNYVINTNYKPLGRGGVCNGTVCSGSSSGLNVDGTNFVSISKPPSNPAPLGPNCLIYCQSLRTFSLCKVDNAMMVAFNETPNMPQFLFPDKSFFIGNTRFVPYSGSSTMNLGVKVGTNYENINPIDYRVIPDIYEMKLLSGSL